MAGCSIETCSIEGCGRAVGKRRLMCEMHYYRKRRGQYLYAPPAAAHGELPAFLDKAAGYTGEACLLWPFGLAKDGYARIKIAGRLYPAHAVVCERVHGLRPTSLHEVAHGCGNRSCVSPKHLRWATKAENQADRLIHGTDSRGSKHGKATLTEADVLAIRAQPSRKGTHLAAEFGVSPKVIYGIRNRKTWAWLKE